MEQEEEEEVSPGADLMREYGVLKQAARLCRSRHCAQSCALPPRWPADTPLRERMTPAAAFAAKRLREHAPRNFIDSVAWMDYIVCYYEGPWLGITMIVAGR